MKIREIVKKILLKEGITHIEDLEIKEFINNLRNIHKFEITEKIDGANLRFGLDSSGRFFTSREAKGGKRYYDSESWGSEFWTTGFKSAHKALEKVVPELINNHLLEPDDVVEIEILFGKLPNTVTYKRDVNQIVFLRPIQLSNNENNKKFENIVDFLKGKRVTVEVENIPYTDDGKTIKFKNETHTWLFDVTPKVDKSLLNKKELLNDLETELKKIEEYLNENSGIADFKNYEVLALNLGKRPEKINKEDWEKAKEIIKIKKAEIYNNLLQHKLNIKDVLLNKFVRNIGSKFGPDVTEGGWIEGVVFRDPVTNDQFKLVDRDFFTRINEFNWKIRRLLKNTKETAKIHDVSGRIRKKMAEDMGMPDFYRNVKIRNFINKNINAKKDPIEELAKNIDFQKTKNGWLNTLNYYKKFLERFLKYYESNKHKLILTLKSTDIERKFEYDSEIDRKTKEAFAEMFSKIDKFIRETENAQNSYDLAKIFLSERMEKM